MVPRGSFDGPGGLGRPHIRKYRLITLPSIENEPKQQPQPMQRELERSARSLRAPTSRTEEGLEEEIVFRAKVGERS